MDAPPFEHLRRFFERIKNVGFFERIFSWQGIVSQGYDAFGEYQRLQNLLGEKDQEITGLLSKNRDFEKDAVYQRERVGQIQQELSQEQLRTQSLNERMAENAKVLNERITGIEGERARLSATLEETVANSDATILQLKEELVYLKAKNEELLGKISERENEAGGLVASDKKNRETIEKLNNDITTLTVRHDNLNSQITILKQELSQYQQIEEDRIREHDERIAALNALRQQLDNDRLRIDAERTAEIKSKFTEMEQTWKKHEEIVEQSLKSICQRHTIEYCDKEKFPVSGKKPDNALLIADQYIIFDAKSPKNSDELGNFRQYIKTQAEAAKKYARDENVKKDIFLVVPANTLEYLDEVHLDMADYQVYVVTHDSLEPIVLALRKIEDYQFVDQLSPEDREKICHVIGKFAHATKRRMQIDTYFFNEFLGLLKSCESLPDDILKSVVSFEKAEKMNPPMEKRKKQIPITDLEHDVKVITKEAEAREIDVAAVTKEKIETIPLDKYLE
jgi:predicted  nucleic acid-binding Zn-ribbon protein